MLVAAVVFVAVLVLGYLLITPRLSNLITSMGLPDWAAGPMGAALYGVLWLFLAGPVFVAIATTISSFAWESFSEEVESLAGLSSPGVRIGRGRVILDSLGRMMFSLLISLAALCGGPLAILLAGLVGLFEYTAPAYQRRGILFGEQRRRVLSSRDWIAFLLVSGLITIIPVVNILMLPSMVAAGTLLCAEAERRLESG